MLPSSGCAVSQPLASRCRCRVKILVVEDDDDLREILAFVLERRGHQVVPTRNGLAALEQWHTVQPDVIVLDSGWPERTGLGVLRSIRQSGTTPVVVITVENDEEHVRECSQLGANQVLVKPFLTRDLIDCVERLSRPKAGEAS